MWTVSKGISFILMMILSGIDIKKRAIPKAMLYVSGASSVLYHLVERKTEWILLIGGAGVGAAFLLFSKITKEGIGYGDSWGILILGSFLGFWKVLTVLAITFFLLLCVLMPLMWIKKMNRKTTLPFFPFLTAGYLFFLFMGG